MRRGLVPIKAALLGAAFLFLAGGCAAPDAARSSPMRGEAWAQTYGFQSAELAAGEFRLLALSRQRGAATTLAVYIEGDGAAWRSPFHPPADPTPERPLVLALAAADPAPAVAYLGRPCQYLERKALAGCDSAYWIERRFAPEVVAAYEAAIDRLKSAAGAQRIRLVGYSGGGVLAALLAMRRQDVEQLLTVAAPLALGDWLAGKQLTPLAGALDPLTQAGVQPLPSGVHFAGSDDKTVPVAVVRRFVEARGGRLEVIDGFDHECCWARDWPLLLSRALATGRAR